MRSGSASAGRAVTLLGAFVAGSVVMGLLLAGLVLPEAWATGTATRGGVSFFNSLPDAQQYTPLQEQSVVLDASGHQIARFYDERRVEVHLSQVAPIMQKAIVAIEDSRFFQHGGVDAKGLLRAFINNRVKDNGTVQGASTLTQQYVKLTNLENAVASGDTAAQAAALSQNYARKIQEIRYAIALEKKMTKQQILEGYLNIANFGDSTYGIEAASEYFFNGEKASQLTLPQAALLAGLVQSPQGYSPFHNPKAAMTRRNVVLARMHQLGIISWADEQTAKHTPLGVKMDPPRNGCISSSYAYFCDYVRNLITTSNDFSALGATPTDRLNELKHGGLTIRTTLNATDQDEAQSAVDDRVPPTNSRRIGATAVTVEPGTGKVLAMAQNRTYDSSTAPGTTEINYAVDEQYGGGTGFQTGSTFKPFTLATWLAAGHGLYDSVDASQTNFDSSEFTTCNGPLGGGSFTVHNSADGEGSGSMSVLAATANSVNLAYMDMATKLSLCDIAATATKLGVHTAYSYNAGCGSVTQAVPDCLPSMVLGALDIAPLTMAAAYAGFADNGTFCTTVAVTSITDRNGKSLKVPTSHCSQALDPNVAHGVTFALKSVLTQGTAAGEGIGRPAAGKTGTTDNSVDTWFVGYTPQLSTAVWVGDNPDPAKGQERSSISDSTLGGESYGEVFGATIAAPIWHDIMEVASQGMPVQDWPDPTGKIMSGSSVTLPDVHGMSVDQAQQTLTDDGFQVSVGSPVTSDLQPDQVESTTPSAGSHVAPHSSVVIHPGNGQGSNPTQSGPTDQGGQDQGGQDQGGQAQDGQGQNTGLTGTIKTGTTATTHPKLKAVIKALLG